MNDNIILYESLCVVNGKRYLGITKRGLEIRRKRHIWTANSGYGSAIGAAIRKYGSNSFQFRTLVICPNWEYAKAMEIAAIARFKPEYNITKGGDGCLGFHHTEEHKTYMSQILKGSKPFLGKKHSPETKEKMSLARLAFWAGRPIKTGTRKRYISRKKYYKPVVLNKRYKPVMLENTGEVFPNVQAAALAVGMDKGSISDLCKGKTKSRRGYRFRYIHDSSLTGG